MFRCSYSYLIATVSVPISISFQAVRQLALACVTSWFLSYIIMLHIEC